MNRMLDSSKKHCLCEEDLLDQATNRIEERRSLSLKGNRMLRDLQME